MCGFWNFSRVVQNFSSSWSSQPENGISHYNYLTPLQFNLQGSRVVLKHDCLSKRLICTIFTYICKNKNLKFNIGIQWRHLALFGRSVNNMNWNTLSEQKCLLYNFPLRILHCFIDMQKICPLQCFLKFYFTIFNISILRYIHSI